MWYFDGFDQISLQNPMNRSPGDALPISVSRARGGTNCVMHPLSVDGARHDGHRLLGRLRRRPRARDVFCLKKRTFRHEKGNASRLHSAVLNPRWDLVARWPQIATLRDGRNPAVDLLPLSGPG